MSPEVEVPPIVLLVQLEGLYPRLEHFQSLLPLGPADNLSDLWREDVEGGDSLSIGVKAHVEGFDVFGVVVEDDRLVEDVVAEVALVLRGQINAPVNLVLEDHSLLDALHSDGSTLRRMSIACV